jgi:hypothetical protein
VTRFGIVSVRNPSTCSRSRPIASVIDRKNALSRAAEIGFEAVKSGDLKEPDPAAEIRPPVRTARIPHHGSQPQSRRASIRSRKISSRDTMVELNVQTFQPPQSFSEILSTRDGNLPSPKPSRSLSISTSWLSQISDDSSRLQKPTHEERSWTQSPDGMYTRTCDGSCREKPLEQKLAKDEKLRWPDGPPHVVSSILSHKVLSLNQGAGIYFCLKGWTDQLG